MEREDFKIINEKNLETCRKIISQGGNCLDVECEVCLFSSTNTKLNCGGNNEETLNLCKEAIKKFGKKGENKVHKLKHHQVTRNELKKFYTYLRKKYNVAGERTNDINSSDKLEEAIEKIIDSIVKRALREQKEKALLRINSL